MKRTLAILSVWLCVSQAQGMLGEENGRPEAHFCPITKAVMRNPVLASDGHTYERAAIEEWLGRKNISPMTGASITSTLVDNLAMKNVINEWRAGSQPSAFAGRSAEEIYTVIHKNVEEHKDLLHSADGRDIIAVLGNTGAGKSTLVNLLAGKELQIGNSYQNYVLVHPEDPEAMTIGSGGDSVTHYPKSIDVGNLRIFDLPGFNDTDGSERNLVNATFIRDILVSARSVRLLVVAGQDQFTADRSASLKQMMQALQNLFIVEEQGRSLFNDAVFVATKVTVNHTEDANFLLTQTAARDKEALEQQLTTWFEAGRLLSMYHPNSRWLEDPIASLEVLRGCLLDLLRQIPPVKICSVNVSALYPPETASDLKRVFTTVMDKEFTRYTQMPLTTVSDYDQKIAVCEGDDFWSVFESLCAGNDATRLLKEFCAGPYRQALRGFEVEHQQSREAYVKALRERHRARIADIETRTSSRFGEVVAALPRAADEALRFDFAYHKDFYDQVCGADTVMQLATDRVEQEIVRKHCVSLINKHARTQMERAIVQNLENAIEQSPLIQALRQQNRVLEETLRHQVMALEERVRALDVPSLPAPIQDAAPIAMVEALKQQIAALEARLGALQPPPPAA